MAKRRRQDSSRASWLATKSEKSIGFILVQMPPGERKSGMPHSVEMPAPVNGTMTRASSISPCSTAMAVFTSGAIIGSQRLLFVPTVLAGEGDPRFSLGHLDAIPGPALAADRLQAGRGLLDGDGLLLHRLADQPLGVLAH